MPTGRLGAILAREVRKSNDLTSIPESLLSQALLIRESGISPSSVALRPMTIMNLYIGGAPFRTGNEGRRFRATSLYVSSHCIQERTWDSAVLSRCEGLFPLVNNLACGTSISTNVYLMPAENASSATTKSVS